jgi:hypothetical protein
MMDSAEALLLARDLELDERTVVSFLNSGAQDVC